MIANLVLDTNIMISGYLWKGKPRQVIQLVKSGKFRLLSCDESIDELMRVFSIKFKFDIQDWISGIT